MKDTRSPQPPEALAACIDADIRALAARDTPNIRRVRRHYSRQLHNASADYVFAVATALFRGHGRRWVAYELIADHAAAFQRLGAAELEAWGAGINSWSSVDSFARTLSGPAWMRGQIADQAIFRWAHSQDRWWRRAALVSTVALNMRSHGGQGDVQRTLAICGLLVADHDDMVVKALSWALRALVVHDAEAVRAFLAQHEDALAARVLREVRNKLETGLKNP